jgi:hypothetical protein
VTGPKYDLEFHLIDLWGRFKDEEHANEYYVLNINPRVMRMWANSEYTRVEWEKRLAIKRGCDLASWMQLYVRSNSNSSGQNSISLEKLKEWCGLSKSRVDHFRNSMKQALAELVRIGEIKDACIRKDMVVFSRIGNKGDDIDVIYPLKQHRDSNTNYRDSNTSASCMFLNIKKFLGRFFP